MFVQFKKICFKNILSYGADVQEFNFEKGICQIVGRNGYGKSAILDTISFNLFGKPYRKIKIHELLNRTNNKKLFTQCFFEIGNDTYSIIRTLKPDSLQIFKNDVEIDQLSSKGLTQDEIDKIIGIDYNLFKQIVSLSINYNKPFLTLGAQDKRNIIEDIFNIKIFSEMLKILKKEITNLQIKNDIDNKTLSIMENNIKSSRKQIREIEKTIENFENNKNQDLLKIEKNINNKNIELKTLNEQNTELLSFQKPLNETKILENQHSKLIKEISIDQYKLKQFKENKKIFENTQCPTCKTNITEEHKQHEIKIIDEQIETILNIITNNKNTAETLEQQIELFKKENEEQKQIDLQLNKIKTRINWVEEEVANLLNQKIDVLNRKLDFNLESLKIDLNKKANEFSTLFEEHEKLLKKIQINETTLGILSDNGIKSHFYKKILPILNSKINQYLSKFEIPIQIQFNDLMEEKIVNLESVDQDISYFSHSEGEKKRIDMAILLSFISLSRLISNWECNILFLDELLDSSIDEDGLENIISCLKQIYNENKQLCVYIISHRLIDHETFTKQIIIKKNNGFSEF